MGKVYGEKPRPWAFVIGVDESSAFADEIRALIPTVRFVDHPKFVREADYDVAIVVREEARLASHLHVVRFGGPTGIWRSVNVQSLDMQIELKVAAGARAERFVLGEAAEDENVVALTEQSVIPAAGAPYEVLAWPAFFEPPLPLNAFAWELGGEPLAGWIARTPGGPELWWLPERALIAGAEWVATALRRWAREHPATFGSEAHWRTDPQWMTQAEREAERALVEHRSRMAREIERLTEETVRLDAALNAARTSADDTERRLLTAQNEALVAEVAAALRELGFDVVDSDALPQHEGAKQEDLRVSDDGWTALVEVKGYARRNAKEGDLLQLGKAVESYILSEGRVPEARWYVVNQSFATPPGQRTRPLAGATALDTFTASGGLVIDTRDLFHLREAVRDGTLAADDARRLLREAKGVFEFAA